MKRQILPTGRYRHSASIGSYISVRINRDISIRASTDSHSQAPRGIRNKGTLAIYCHDSVDQWHGSSSTICMTIERLGVPTSTPEYLQNAPPTPPLPPSRAKRGACGCRGLGGLRSCGLE